MPSNALVRHGHSRSHSAHSNSGFSGVRSAANFAWNNRAKILKEIKGVANAVTKKRKHSGGSINLLGGGKDAGPSDVKAERGGGGDRQPSVKIAKKKGVQTKKKLAVKVSANFRKKVEKVEEEKMRIKGHYTKVRPGICLGVPSSNQQFVIDGFGCTASSGAASTGIQSLSNPTAWSFNPEFFVNVASVLFNGKQDSDTVTNNQVYNSGNFQYVSQLKFTIVQSSTIYEIKNTCGRTLHIEIYLCRPKQIGFYNYGYTYSAVDPPASTDIDKFDALNTTNPLPNPGVSAPVTSWNTGQTAGSAGVGAAICPPAIQWVRAMASEKLLGANLNTTNPTALGISPKQSMEWNKYYNADRTSIILEPGESYSYVIQGPNGYEFNMQKHFKGNVFMNVQKYMLCPLVVLKNDLVRTSSASGARLNDITLPELVIERTDKVTLDMPEQAGFEFPVAAVIGDLSLKAQGLTFRRPVYFYGVSPGTILSGVVSGTVSLAYGAEQN